MSHTHLKDALTPGVNAQSEPITGREVDMVANSAGGFVFPVDKWTRLQRFLILGSEGGSYYASEAKLTKDNAKGVLDCLREDGARTVRTIVEISTQGRAPKNDQAIFALALATVPAYADEETRGHAFDAIPSVCRTGTHLYQFCDIVDGLRGWGQGLKRGVSAWFLDKEPEQLAYQAVKYRQRAGWTGRDVLRSAHPNFGRKDPIIDWILGHEVEGELPPAIEAFGRAQAAQSPAEVVKLIGEYGRALPHEAIPTNLKANGEVWQALLEQGLPMTAMIRNLANMTRYGVLAPNSAGERLVREALASEEAIRKARVHPMAVLKAMKTYANGGRPSHSLWSYMGSGSRSHGEPFTPNQRIVDALDSAFYTSFGNVEPSGKRFVLGIDVSGSMGALMNDSVVSCAEGAAAMALVTDHAEPYCATHGFAGSFVDLGISSRMRLEQAVNKTSRMNFGSTDCSLPMIWALQNGVEADVFCVYTDSETWAGRIHPSQALQRYRKETGIPAKLVVVGMVSNGFTIADPSDAGMLDVVGFDTSTPDVISGFAAGRI